MSDAKKQQPLALRHANALRALRSKARLYAERLRDYENTETGNTTLRNSAYERLQWAEENLEAASIEHGIAARLCGL